MTLGSLEFSFTMKVLIILCSVICFNLTNVRSALTFDTWPDIYIDKRCKLTNPFKFSNKVINNYQSALPQDAEFKFYDATPIVEWDPMYYFVHESNDFILHTNCGIIHLESQKLKENPNDFTLILRRTCNDTVMIYKLMHEERFESDVITTPTVGIVITRFIIYDNYKIDVNEFNIKHIWIVYDYKLLGIGICFEHFINQRIENHFWTFEIINGTFSYHSWLIRIIIIESVFILLIGLSNLLPKLKNCIMEYNIDEKVHYYYHNDRNIKIVHIR